MTDYRLESYADFDNDGTTEALEYNLNLNQNIDRNGNIPSVVFPTGSPETSVVTNFQGKTEEINIQIIVSNNEQDKTNGSFSSLDNFTDSNLPNDTVVTVEEQIYYLRHYIQTPVFGASWRLRGGEFEDWDGDGTDEGTPVSLTTMNVTENAENPTVATVEFKFKVGDVA